MTRLPIAPALQARFTALDGQPFPYRVFGGRSLVLFLVGIGHPVLVQGAHTQDNDQIRHSRTDEPTVQFGRRVS